jgi:hypothetical protein
MQKHKTEQDTYLCLKNPKQQNTVFVKLMPIYL